MIATNNSLIWVNNIDIKIILVIYDSAMCKDEKLKSLYADATISTVDDFFWPMGSKHYNTNGRDVWATKEITLKNKLMNFSTNTCKKEINSKRKFCLKKILIFCVKREINIHVIFSWEQLHQNLGLYPQSEHGSQHQQCSQ